MAEVTVTQLADAVNIPVEKLLQQMQDAGLDHKGAEQIVSDDEKQQLLSHLKKSHGGDTAETGKKITLKRKSVSKLKVAGSAGKAKTVNVEVRKKRTYVKRSVLLDEEAAAKEAKEAELAAQEKEAEEARLAEEERKAEEIAKITAEREQKCADSRARMERYLQARRLYKEDENGERVYLDDAQVMEARSQAQEDIQAYCG